MTSPADPPPRQNAAPTRLPSWDSPAFKIWFVAALLLLMLIPMYFLNGLTQDRAANQENALAEYRKSWGPGQTVLGPIWIVPYVTAAGAQRQYLQIAPQRLKLAASLQPEIRRRGLFRVTVYEAKAAITGEFRVPPEAVPKEPGAHIFWEDSAVILGATDLRALSPDTLVNWSGRDIPLEDARVVGEIACANYALLAARPGINEAPIATVSIAATLTLRGTGVFRVAPIGRQVDVTVSTPRTPLTFSGISLPNFKRDETSIVADWTVTNNVASGRRDWWSTKAPTCQDGSGTTTNPDRQINIELVEAVPIYHMVERASKYGILFLTLSFLTYFLFELIARIHIHLVQYGLLGLSITLFGLLLISLGEPLGFTLGYALSSLLILAQASLFTGSVTGRTRLAGIFAAILAALFGFLYVVLSLEAFSLLVGSVALFAALSVLMAVTRYIDWSSTSATPGSAPPAPPRQNGDA